MQNTEEMLTHLFHVKDRTQGEENSLNVSTVHPVEKEMDRELLTAQCGGCYRVDQNGGVWEQ